VADSCGALLSGRLSGGLGLRLAGETQQSSASSSHHHLQAIRFEQGPDSP